MFSVVNFTAEDTEKEATSFRSKVREIVAEHRRMHQIVPLLKISPSSENTPLKAIFDP